MRFYISQTHNLKLELAQENSGGDLKGRYEKKETQGEGSVFPEGISRFELMASVEDGGFAIRNSP